MKKIGFIGLGNMGSRMSIHLIKAGHQVSGFDVNEELVDKLVFQGVKKANSISDLSKDKDVIITMLPNGSVVEKVLNNVLNHVQDTTSIVDCSTIDVKTSQKLHKLALNKKISLFDAPVSGGTIGASNGTLTFMIGGDPKTYEEISPILSLMGSKLVFCGASGSGQATKLCNNMLLATTMIGVSESFNMAKKLNLDLNVLYDVISTATGSCWAVNNYCPVPNIGPQSPADNNFLPGFSAKLMSKDLKLAVKAAQESNSNISFGKKAEELFTKMSEGTRGDEDFSAIIKEIE